MQFFGFLQLFYRSFKYLSTKINHLELWPDTKAIFQQYLFYGIIGFSFIIQYELRHFIYPAFNNLQVNFFTEGSTIQNGIGQLLDFLKIVFIIWMIGIFFMQLISIEHIQTF